jgi:predicted nucleic acid-binding protein
MLAVSNTSPISNLAVIGRIDLLKAQFPEIWIPTAVARELDAHPDPRARSAIEAAIRDGWVKIMTPGESALRRVLLRQLHDGESEAIALATELGAQILLIDEQEGRNIATQVGLRVTGTLGILLRAKCAGDIPEIRAEIQALRSRGRFFLSARLEAEVLKAAGEVL